MRMALDTLIIVALITLLGTIVNALGREMIRRWWPVKKKTKEADA